MSAARRFAVGFILLMAVTGAVDLWFALTPPYNSWNPPLAALGVFCLVAAGEVWYQMVEENRR